MTKKSLLFRPSETDLSCKLRKAITTGDAIHLRHLVTSKDISTINTGARDNDGSTYLDLAVTSENLETTEELLKVSMFF